MEKSVPTRLGAACIAIALAISLAPLAKASRAEAADLQSTTMEVQATNYLPATAETLTLGKATTGEFVDYVEGSSSKLEAHWYKFNTSSRNSKYRILFESLDGNSIYYWLNNQDFKQVGNSGGEMFRSISTSNVKYFSDLDRNATYYIDVHAGWNDANGQNPGKRYTSYKITVSELPILLKTTGVRATKKAKTSLAIKWNSQKNATKYQVKYKAKGGSWKTVNTTKSTLSLKKLKKNTQYQFKIRAYCKGAWNYSADKMSNWGAWSDTKTVKTKR